MTREERDGRMLDMMDAWFETADVVEGEDMDNMVRRLIMFGMHKPRRSFEDVLRLFLEQEQARQLRISSIKTAAV